MPDPHERYPNGSNGTPGNVHPSVCIIVITRSL